MARKVLQIRDITKKIGQRTEETTLSLHTNNKIVMGDNAIEKISFPFYDRVSCIRHGLRNYI